MPSGIASDLTASAFFKSVATTGRVLALFDFENRRGEGGDGKRRPEFFPDVDSRFKFCSFIVAGPKRRSASTELGFFLRDAPEQKVGDDVFSLTPADFALVNPNTGTAPIFRGKRDADLTTAIYRRLPILVDRSSGTEMKAWPVKYVRMFDMTNDSHLFWTRPRLEEEGAYPAPLGRWKKGEEEWLPLYVGRMIHQFDHRAASVTVNEENIHNAASSEQVTIAQHADRDFSPEPQFWVSGNSDSVISRWTLCFRDIARSTDERTAIGAIVPRVAAGNTLPNVTGLSDEAGSLMTANFNSLCFDYVARQKNQSTHLNWYIVEQLPVVPREAYARRIGATTAADLVKDHVLRLSYTAWDMEPFARDMGHAGDPFVWNEIERRHLRARLDALYFILYGVSDEDDIRYILSTFPIVERKDREAHTCYLTAELIAHYKRMLEAGDLSSPYADATAPEVRITARLAAEERAALALEATLIRAAKRLAA